MMKKVVLAILVLLLIVPATVSARGQDGDVLERILDVYPHITKEQLVSDIEYASQVTQLPQDVIASQMYDELREKKPVLQNKITVLGGKGNGAYQLASSSKGNVFFETASTAGIPHGHVGIYYTTDYIVESVPGSGVRKVKLIDKRVDSGSKILTPKSQYASASAREQAADWAHGRIGESYSYNFAQIARLHASGIRTAPSSYGAPSKKKRKSIPIRMAAWASIRSISGILLCSSP